MPIDKSQVKKRSWESSTGYLRYNGFNKKKSRRSLVENGQISNGWSTFN